ncbi:hypothetical protein IAR55_004997 [Kwoniella newhampshirensis]|uniref:BRCA2 OB1 domain-containing protein n=1 Tax=Kwoniella newhampshirensis TaxID=1651941 RepID=A0AAW0YWC4_9TREE
MGTQEALRELQQEHCTFATAQWVDNHWTQILWKLAGQVQAKPDLFLSKWSWLEITSQLRYRSVYESRSELTVRYEREFGAAQRPILRRIQEHDSSPSLPMILLVSAVHNTSDGEKELPKAYLELSDGWYRIRAQLDDCLSRAVAKGKIAVGRKMAVTGAKPQPFIASLSSLSIDGGIVSLMDVVIDNVFPLMFTNGDRTVRESPWNEDEEQIRQDRWKAERTRLEDKMRRDLGRLEDLAGLLAQYAEESDQVYIHLARHASERLSQEMQNVQSEIGAELQVLCPPRNVRDLRMVRFHDAQEGRKEAFRLGSLNLWDARAMDSAALQEGRRYLVSNITSDVSLSQVSNLVPGRTGDWGRPRSIHDKATILLHTRRDTRWQPL